MKFGSLFAGIGGIDLGLERAGMECIWQVEIDDYCRRVLEKHWPKVKRYGDVRGVGKHNLETVDLIAGGFPCQPHSVAGKRKGAADDRNLWPEFDRVIAELKPRFVLAENVPGIITTYLDTVLSDLESQGYACATFNIPALAFDAPHRRERIFIVAHDKSQREGRLSIRPGGPLKTAADVIGGGEDLADSQSADERGTRSPSGGQQIKVGRRGTQSGEIISDTKIRQDDERERRNLVEAQEGGEGGDSSSGVGRENVSIASGERLEGEESEGRRSRESRLSTECSWWAVEPDVGRVAHGIPSRVDRLRGLGNAVVPQVAEWIGHRIMQHDKNYLGVE